MFKKCTLLWRKAAKRISKSKCTTHTRFGALLEVEMWKKCTLLWREPHFKVKSVKSWRSRKVQMWQEHPVAPFSVLAFCTISSSSGPLKVHFVWEALSVFLFSMHKMMWKLAGVFGKSHISLVFSCNFDRELCEI